MLSVTKIHLNNMSDKTTLEMQTEYEVAIAEQMRAKSRAIEAICDTFSEAIKAGESQNMPNITTNLAAAIENAYKLFDIE